MTPLETNKPVFFDVDGEPLEGGEIYIGQPDTDPRTNAKTVTFRDAGGAEFTAKQPLNTIAGRVVYNGKPIVALVDGEYSMLIFNSSGVQVDYEASVNAAADSTVDLSDTIQVGLTLSEIKSFDVAVGDVVRNVGKAVVSDGLGEDWYVVSNTGSGGDDITLIDFTNGLQGQRYRIGPIYQTATVELGGDFNAGEQVKVTRIGDKVTISSITGALSHPSNNTPVSAVGAIPDWARPTGATEIFNIYGAANGPEFLYAVSYSDGKFGTAYRTSTFGGPGSALLNTAYPPTISYNV